MLSKIKELDESAVKFQKTIADLHTELASAKTEGAKAEEKLQAKVHEQEVQIAKLKMQVQYSGHIHSAFLAGAGLGGRNIGSFASPASSASTATPPAPQMPAQTYWPDPMD